MDYTDLDTVEIYGGFKNLSPHQESLLEHFITTASNMIDNYCGRVFGIEPGAAATARTFTMENGLLPKDYSRKLYFDDDIYTITSVPTISAGVTLTWLPDHPPYYAIIRSEGTWEDPTTIVAYWAYAETPPALIVNCAIRLTCWLYHQTEAVMSDGNTVNTPNTIPSDIRVILNSYRRVRLP